MSVPSISPASGVSVFTASSPSLSPERAARHGAFDAATYSDKALVDLEMRKTFPDLWREVRSQSSQMKAEQKEKSGASPDNAPRMVQAADTKRDAAQQISRCWQSHSIAWLKVAANDYQLKAELVGFSDPHNLCIGEVPVFIDGDATSASALLPDYMVNGKQRALLDFTAHPAVDKQCNATASFDCVAPDESVSVNDQIDALLDFTSDAYIYLSPAQMDSWAASHAAELKSGQLRYVRLSASPVDRDARTRLGGIIAGAVIIPGLLVAGAVALVRRCTGKDEGGMDDTAVNMAAVNPPQPADESSSSV